MPSGGLSQGPARLVPLIAVDQMPEWIEVVGVPRQLEAKDTINMVAIVGHEVGGDEAIFEVNVLEKDPAVPAKTSTKINVEDDDKKNPVISFPTYVEKPKVVNTMTTKEVEPLVVLETDDTVDDQKVQVVSKEAKVEAAPVLIVQYTPSITPKSPPSKATLLDVEASAVTAVSASSADSNNSFKSAKSPKSPKGPKSPKSPTSSKNTKSVTSTPDNTLADFCQLIERLNGKTMSQYFLNDGDEIVVITQPKIIDKYAYEFPRRESEGSDVVVENLIDFEAFQKEGEKKNNEPVCYDTPGNRPPEEATMTTKTTPSKEKTSAKKSPKTKSAWTAQKKRDTATVKPCKHWCKTGTCNFGTRCRFAHIMPERPEGLRSVDLDQLPEWWVAKQEEREAAPENRYPAPTSLPPVSRGRRMSTSPLPPPRHVRCGSVTSCQGNVNVSDTVTVRKCPTSYYHNSVQNNSAMQTSRLTRFWKPTQHQNPINSLTSSRSSGSMAAHRDQARQDPLPALKDKKVAPAEKQIDFTDIDLVDL
ncbi:hypothetical protein SEUCBS139899_001279 [Sporothrix eucalyptigena]|uniref:C3H1-type domain-containing protein n=1 Tax=Sporothrix eucalyptigena TaxID=1812306 RepID=A0ABP0C680_9PEZI